MTHRVAWSTILGTVLAANSVWAQTAPTRPPLGPQQSPAVRPTQPVVPRDPRLERRPAVAPQPVVPFRLTAQQEAELDQVLLAWERRSANVKTFECSFTRWEYDPVFGDATKPRFVDQGQIKYAAPDRGMFKIEGERAEHWICDGKAVFQYDREKKQVIEHKLPPSLQGKDITDGPLPFLFGAKADKLKQRYFLKIITPNEVKNTQVWLEAYPRFQQDAANFLRAELILTLKDMTPFGMQIFAPNEKNRTAYHFHDIVVNDPLRFFKVDPFRASTPFGWKKIVEEPPAEQAARPAVGGRR
jgi:TIGR03009 family protein